MVSDKQKNKITAQMDSIWILVLEKKKDVISGKVHIFKKLKINLLNNPKKNNNLNKA